MVDVITVTLVAFALGASFFAAWAIGAGSTGSTPFAPAVGAGAISTMRAAFIVGLLGFSGAVLQGAAITETVGRGLIGGVTLSPLAATVALFIAVTYITAGVFRGYPIATAFAITGSVVGVGVAMGGDPAWDRYLTIGTYWLLTPVFVAPVAYAVTRLLRSERASNRVAIPMLAGVVGAVISNMEFLLVGPADVPQSIALWIAERVPLSATLGVAIVTAIVATGFAVVMYASIDRDAIAAQRWFLLAIGSLVAFSAGGGQVGLAVGPLLPLLEEVAGSTTVTPVLLFGGTGMLLGTWLAATRMIKALSQDYSALGPRRSIGVLIPAFVIAQIGIFFGMPMSFNEIFISAITGAGLASGSGGVSARKLGFTALAWIGSLAFSLFIGYGVYTAISAVTGLS
ncbi:MAG: anion permease [Halobacteriota archaeon]